MEELRVAVEDVDHLLGWSLIRAAHQVERQLTALFGEHDLTPVQFGVLVHLAGGLQVTQAELARTMLVRPQSMAAVIDGLVGRGLLERTGRRGRGRRNPIAVSTAGASLLARLWPVVVAADERMTAGMTPVRVERVRRDLVRVLANSLSDDAVPPHPDRGGGRHRT